MQRYRKRRNRGIDEASPFSNFIQESIIMRENKIESVVTEISHKKLEAEISGEYLSTFSRTNL